MGFLLVSLIFASMHLSVSAETPRYLVQDVVNVQLIGGLRQDRLSTNLDGLGDINGDGFGDFALSTNQFVEEPRVNYVYVIFGSAKLPGIVDLLVPPQNTFVVSNERRVLRCSGIGDFNGDGLDDLVITNASKNIGGAVWAGEALIVAGTSALSGEIRYSDIEPYARIQGHRNEETFGNVLARAGDFNGDGLADIAMLSFYDYYNSRRAVTVIYGSTDFPGLLTTADLGRHGTVIHDAFAYDRFGADFACVGDVNGDGFDDLLIGADAWDDRPDRAYLIYGGTDLPPVIEASNLGKYGVVIEGGSNSNLGAFVAGAGDVNRDGYADLLLSRFLVSAGGVTKAGETYIIFGDSNLPGTIDVRSLGSRGITIRGAETDEALGALVAGPADWDGDEYPEIAIAPSVRRHEVYLMKGGEAYSTAKTIWVNQLERAIIHDDNPVYTTFPFNIRFIGDVNGDGYDDLAVADWFYNYGDRYGAGTAYIFYGGQFFETPTATPTPLPTESPTPSPTPELSPTPQDPESFSGWILSGEGREGVLPVN